MDAAARASQRARRSATRTGAPVTIHSAGAARVTGPRLEAAAAAQRLVSFGSDMYMEAAAAWRAQSYVSPGAARHPFATINCV